MSYRVLLTNKLRLASAAIASVMLATFIFPSAYVLADTISTDSATPDTSASAPALTPAAAPLTNPTTADATATTGIAVTDHSTTVSASDVATTLAHDGGVLAASDQTKTTSDSDSAMQAVTAGASVDVPKDPSDGVTLSATNGPKLDITLPNADNSQDAKQVAPGTVAYPDNNGSASAVQATEDGGVRMLTIIDNPNAPRAYDYKVSVPDGGKVVLNEDGSAAVIDSTGNLLATVAKPWAHDATGRAIDTYFTTDGTNLVQHIKHNVLGIVYPVSADPRITVGWSGVTEYMNKRETQLVAWGTGATFAYFGWTGISGVVAFAITTGGQYAVDHGYCLAVNLPWYGIPLHGLSVNALRMWLYAC